MKRQILLFPAVLISLTVFGQMKVEVPKTLTAPTIDGVVDEVWSKSDTVGIRNIFIGESPSVTATWKALWDDNALYFLVEVADDVLLPFSSHSATDTKEFKYDKVEAYFDINDLLIDSLGPGSLSADERLIHSNGHVRSSPTMDEAVYGIENKMDAADYRDVETLYCYKLSATGYVLESKIYWDKFIFPDGVTMDAAKALNREIGFDIVIVDRDVLEGNRQRVAWQFTGATTTEPNKSMDESGIIICKSVTTGTSITKNSSDVRVYPNPAQNIIHLENAVNNNFKLINLSGQILINRTINKDREVVDISTLIPGIYILSVNGNNQKLVVK